LILIFVSRVDDVQYRSNDTTSYHTSQCQSGQAFGCATVTVR
jgi:hypothetical protein